MRLKNVAIKNFRLLQDVSLMLESRTTVVVGQNNSGKTSLTEVMRRILEDGSPTFRLEDFSFGTHQTFWDALNSSLKGADDNAVRKALPTIEIRLTFEYKVDEALGTLSEFVIDLDPNCTEASVIASYGLKDGKVEELFAGLGVPDDSATDQQVDAAKVSCFKSLRDRIPLLFAMTFTVVDPNDPENTKVIEGAALRRLCGSGFIGAQRGLDDVSHKDRVVIGKVLENLFATAKNSTADTDGHGIAEELELAVANIQDKIGADFNVKLDALLPALSLFGYPSLGDQQKLRTETALDVSRLLTNHTKVRYTGVNGVNLPEGYNGLGTRNLILILLQLREFFKVYASAEPRPGTQVVFIEEPEVHLHPHQEAGRLHRVFR